MASARTYFTLLNLLTSLQFTISELEARKSWLEVMSLNATPTKDVRTFVFGMITDLDELSPVLKVKNDKLKETGNLVAYLREGILTLTRTSEEQRPFNVSLQLDGGRVHEIRNRDIIGRFAYAGRGMEMSTLTTFKGNLCACDDKTGIIYQLRISDSQHIVPVPWVVLAEGNFQGPKGFKCEWSTVKDGNLVIGGHGGRDNFVKVVTPEGSVTHVNWTEQFRRISEALQIDFPGFVTHEAIAWSDTLEKWVILPRKVSSVAFAEEIFDVSGTNIYLLADEDFENIEVKEIGDQVPTHGFSGFRFVPTTDDSVLVALKSVEVGDLTETYIMVFDLIGNVLFPETKLAAQKYEALEFIAEI